MAIGLLGTLNTKGPEVAFLKRRLELTEEVVGAGWYQPVEPGRPSPSRRDSAAGLPTTTTP